jgi:hypothetical protein
MRGDPELATVATTGRQHNSSTKLLLTNNNSNYQNGRTKGKLTMETSLESLGLLE